MKRVIGLSVNGESHEVAIEPNRTLVKVLRQGLGLTGTKQGCDDGACGCCTVIMDGRPVLSCLVLATDAQGKEILTIEGLAANGHLHPLQLAFIEHGAIQCGFCTPGMILSAKALLDEDPEPTPEKVKIGMSGNLCRCTGYVKITQAILSASKALGPGGQQND